MDLYSLVKTLHILSATILFGTGLGIAFFMFRGWYAEDPREKLFAIRTTAIADYILHGARRGHSTGDGGLADPEWGIFLDG